MSKAEARPTDGRGPSTPAQAAGRGSSKPARTDPATTDHATAAPAPSAAAPAASVAADSAAPSEPSAPWAGWEPIVRAGGVVVAIVFAFVSAVFELLLTTLRAGDFLSIWKGDPIGSGGGPLIPLAVVLAVVGNLGIAWFAVGTTGRRWALGPPWALWTIVMLIAAGVRTHEGDYLLSGTNYVALAMILIGSLTFAIYTYRMILKPIPRTPGSTSGKPRN
jgi:hypothetical protein